jgi:hypothetical protein
MRRGGDSIWAFRKPMRLAFVRHCAGISLFRKSVLPKQRSVPDFDSDSPHCDWMMVFLNRPCDFNYACFFGPDHQANSVGFGLCGAGALSAGVTEIAQSAQCFIIDSRGPICRALAAIEIAQRGRYGDQFSQRQTRNE